MLRQKPAAKFAAGFCGLVCYSSGNNELQEQPKVAEVEKGDFNDYAKEHQMLAAVAVLLLVVVGALSWTRSSEKENTKVDNPTIQRPPRGVVSPTPKLDVRAVALQSKGTGLMVKREFSQAAEAFRQSLQVQEDPFVKLLLGRALAKAGRKDEAKQVFKEIAQGQSEWSSQAQKALENLQRGSN